MAGKIVADTLEHSTAGSIATNYVVSGTAKAWVNFDGTGTVAIRESFSTSSITDNGTGEYTVNFSPAMSDADYSALVSSVLLLSGVNTSDQVFSFTTGSVRVRHTENNAGTDTSIICVGILR